MNVLTVGLDILGVIDPFGIIADLLNAGLSAAQEKYDEAILAVVAAIPVLGTALLPLKWVKKGMKIPGIEKSMVWINKAIEAFTRYGTGLLVVRFRFVLTCLLNVMLCVVCWLCGVWCMVYFVYSAPALKKFAGELGDAAAKLDAGAATKTLKVFANIIETIADVLIWISTKGDAVIAWGVNIVKKVESTPLKHFNAFIEKVQTFALKILDKIGCGPDGGSVPKWGVVLFEKVGAVLKHFDMFKTESAWVKAISPCLLICQETLKPEAKTPKDAFAEVTKCVKSVGEEFAKLLNPCWYEGPESEETTETSESFFLDIKAGKTLSGKTVSGKTLSETDTCAAEEIYFHVEGAPTQEELNDEAISDDVEFAAGLDAVMDSPRKLTAGAWTIGGVKFGAVSFHVVDSMLLCRSMCLTIVFLFSYFHPFILSSFHPFILSSFHPFILSSFLRSFILLFSNQSN